MPKIPQPTKRLQHPAITEAERQHWHRRSEYYALLDKEAATTGLIDEVQSLKDYIDDKFDDLKEELMDAVRDAIKEAADLINPI